MADNPFDRFDAPAARPRPAQRPMLTQKRDLELEGARSNLASDAMGRAKAAADLRQAPIDQARAQEALRVEKALADAEIRKGLATADTAEAEATAAKLKAKYPQLTEGQALAMARYVNMDEGNLLYEDALKDGYRPDAMGNKAMFLLDKVPLIGQEAADWIRSPVAEQAALGERIYKAGQLRAETGAGDRATEGPDVKTRTFPSPFTADTQRRREQLRRVRRRQIAAQRITAGGGADAVDKAAPAVAPTAAPKVGQVVKGYRFKGGNPASQTSWEKVK